MPLRTSQAAAGAMQPWSGASSTSPVSRSTRRSSIPGHGASSPTTPRPTRSSWPPRSGRASRTSSTRPPPRPPIRRSPGTPASGPTWRRVWRSIWGNPCFTATTSPTRWICRGPSTPGTPPWPWAAIAWSTPLFQPSAAAGLDAIYRIEIAGTASFCARIARDTYEDLPHTLDVDCVISADAVTALLVIAGRLRPWPAIALGGLRFTGARPEIGPRFFDLFVFP